MFQESIYPDGDTYILELKILLFIVFFVNVLDPMTIIITRMPLKRQKRSFIDRLLELGIIKDKKECRKKRQKKSDAKSTDTDDDKSNGKFLNNLSLNLMRRIIVYCVCVICPILFSRSPVSLEFTVNFFFGGSITSE